MTEIMLKPTGKLVSIICGLLLITLGAGSELKASETGINLHSQSIDLNHRPSSSQQPELRVPVETLLALAETEKPSVTENPPGYHRQQPLLLPELIRHMVSTNQQVQIQKTDWMIRQAEAEQSRAIFEPELSTSITRESNKQRNSVEEALGRGLTATYDEQNWRYDASVEALVPTGGKIKLGYNLNDLSDSLTRSLTDEENEYQMYLGINLTQPLLKNAGTKMTRAGIMTADLESTAAFQEYRLKMMQRVSKVSVDYWGYYQAYKKLTLREDSCRIAKQILTDNRVRHRTGKMAETEVLEAIIGVNTRKSLLSETAHEQFRIANRLRNLLALTSSSSDKINLPLPARSSSHQQIKPVDLQTTPLTTIRRIEFKKVIDNSEALIFTVGKNQLTSAMKTQLINLAKTLKDKPNLFLKVIGHTDSYQLSATTVKIYGDNYGLGRARADSTANYLADLLGLNKHQYKIETAGPFEPVTDNNTAAGRAKNRRVEIFISYDQTVSVKSEGLTKTATVSAENEILAATPPLNLDISEPDIFDRQNFNSSEIIENAFNLRPEYLAARKKLRQAEIKISFARNQRWPELDLLASYGLNGLDFNNGDSWKQIKNGDYPSWSAGLRLRLPLQGGKESRSKLRKSELEKRRQLMVMKDIEIELKNRIDTAIDNVIRTTEQLKYARQIIAIQKRLFDAELEKLQAGQSSSRLVLEKEDDYRSARETALARTVKQQIALVEMELASGTILQKYGVDIMETTL